MARLALAFILGFALFSFVSAGLLPSFSAEVSTSTSGRSGLVTPILKLLLKLRNQVVKSVGGVLAGDKLRCMNSVLAGIVTDVRVILATTLHSVEDLVTGDVDTYRGRLLGTLLRELKHTGRLMMEGCVA